MKKIFEKPRGQVMAVYAGALAFMLCGAVALGTDVAVMYVNWQHSQKTVDAAAIAGANFLNGTSFSGTVDPSCTGQPDSASKAACTYSVKNGLAAGALTISDTATTIKVSAQEAGLPYFFGKALGLSTYTVASSATSGGGGTVQTVLGSLNTTTTTNLGLVPLGLQCATPCATGSLVAGQSVSFGNKFLSSVINDPLAGNWGWLDLDGSGGAGLKNDLAYGATKTYTVGQSVNTDPGAKNGPIKQGLNMFTLKWKRTKKPLLSVLSLPILIWAYRSCFLNNFWNLKTSFILLPAKNGCGRCIIPMKTAKQPAASTSSSTT